MLTTNHTMHHLRHILAALAVLGSSWAAAAEFHLRPQSRPDSSVVRLGDVADVLSSNPAETESLCATELFPAPAGIYKRTVTARQIQDALVLRGINLGNHQFSGASQVEIQRPAEKAAAKTRLTSIQAKQSSSAVRAAILNYIEKQSSTAEPWEVTFELTDDQAATVLATKAPLQVAGGIAPWVGLQQFDLMVRAGEQQSMFTVAAQVTLPTSVVVAMRPIAVGQTISPADVQLQQSQGIRATETTCQRLEDVLGQQATRPIAAGALIETSVLRSPLLVRRGDLVVVIARSAGVQVTTRGKSREDGSHGELVEIEPLGSKGKFVARVSGSQQVEIYARAIAVDSN